MLTFSDGGVYKIVVHSQFLTTPQMRNIFQLRLETGGTLSQADGVEDIQDWVVAMYTELVTHFENSTQVTGFEVYALEGVNMTGFIPLDSPMVGTGGATPTPSAVAMLTYMPLGERRRQLRKYWGVFDKSKLNANGVWDSAIVTEINDAIAPLLLTTYEGTHGAWRFGYYKTGFPDSFTVPVSVVTTNNPVVQRRRRAGTGI